MKNSKKFMTRVLTAALILSMLTSTGVCVSAVDDEIIVDDEPIVVAPIDDETPTYLARLEALKALLSEAVQSTYAKLSQTTLSQLMQITQKVKSAEQIMADAEYQVSAIKAEVSNQVAQIKQDAETLIASADYDEDFETQIMETVEQKVTQIVDDAQAQIDQIMANAEESSTALLDDADAQLAALKAKLQDRLSKAAEALQEKADAIQQQVTAVKEQVEVAVQQTKEAIEQTAAVKLAKAALKTIAAQQIMIGAASQVAQIQTDANNQADQIMAEAEELIAAADDEEFTAQLMEKINQKVSQLLADTEEQVTAIMADAQAKADTLLAEAEELTSSAKDTLREEIILVQKKIIEVKKEVEQAVADLKANIENFNAELLQKFIEKTTETAELDDGEFSYTIYNTIFGTYAAVTGYMGEEENVVIPAYINEIPVKRFLFESETVKSVTLPDTITYVTGDSFGLLGSLESIEVSEDNANFTSVDGVLYNKSGKKLVAVPLAKEYTIPEGITSIGEGAFFAHTAMTSIEIPDSVTVIGATAFENCWNLEEVTIPYGVTSIGAYAFSNCRNLKKAVIPSSVEKIYEDAFSNVAEDFAIYCDAYDYAAEYAAENGIKVISELFATVNIYFEDENAYENNVMAFGTSVRFEAEPLGGSGEYLYACYYKKADSDKWIARQSFTADKNDVTFTPKETGAYNICVKVKDTDGNLRKIYIDIEVVGDDVEHTKSYISATEIELGQTVKAVAVAEAGKENCTYAFYYKKVDSNNWNCRQKFSEKDTTTITPAEDGEYDICIKTKDENGKVSKEYFTLTVARADEYITQAGDED